MPTERNRLHFVGSIPLSSSEDVFRQLGTQVGQFLRRMPDGETGERTLWIKFQQKMLFEHPAMEPDPTHPPLPVMQADGTVHRHIQLLRLKPDADPATVEFQTGYDRAAATSYSVFRELRDAHFVPAHMRLQVALPTPMATGLMYVSPAGRDRYLRAYELSLLEALRNILSVIPHRDLSIQFDVCQEVLLFENYFPAREPNYKQPVFEQFARLGAAVPNDVELGFHLCYGSPGDQPLLILKDAGVLAELMKGISDFVRRPVEFIHIPFRSTRPKFFLRRYAIGAGRREPPCIWACCSSMTRQEIKRGSKRPSVSSTTSASPPSAASDEPIQAACLRSWPAIAPPRSLYRKSGSLSASRSHDRRALQDVHIFLRVILQLRNMGDETELRLTPRDAYIRNFGRAG
jgi:hypothetical protein